MKKLSLILALLMIFVVISCSSSKKATAEDEGAVWTEDYAAAVKLATESKRPILINFTGSDWCIWCHRLDGEVFSQSEFAEYARDNLVLFKADFPNELEQSDELKAQNRGLAQKYEIEGFPTIMLVDVEGNVLAQTGYIGVSAGEYVEHLKGFLEGPIIEEN
jgi:protein disulfide-isomerase